MITFIDTTVFPLWLKNNVFTTLSYDGDKDMKENDFLWATPEIALRERVESRRGGSASKQYAKLLPFVAYYREGGYEYVPEGSSNPLAESYKFIDDKSQKSELQAVRVRYSYNVTAYFPSVLQAVEAEKVLAMLCRIAYQSDFSSYNIPVGYQFSLDSTDTSNMFFGEEKFKSGKIQTLNFTIDVETMLVTLSENIKGYIEKIRLNLYLYNNETVPEEIVIE